MPFQQHPPDKGSPPHHQTCFCTQPQNEQTQNHSNFSMQNHLPHGGVVAVSGGPALSREEVIDMVTPSEEFESYPDELELGLGLSLGGGKAMSKTPAAAGGVSWDRYATFLTAKDFPGKASSSSSSSVVNSGPCGSKRAAESPASPPGRSAISQVVGWPPVRTYRANTLANQSKSPATENFFSAVDKCQTKNTVVDKTNNGGSNNKAREKNTLRKTSLFVKVNMDGAPIGRKVDLNAHSCYNTLAHALDNMFGSRRLNTEEKVVSLQLLAASSDFVLTYEDREGDWMLVGDVPWEMFLSSARRLRIMRTADANGLAPVSNERSWNPSTAPT